MTNETPANLYIPSNVHLGGQRTSNSQIKTIAICEFEGFLNYLAPCPGVPDSAGLRSRVVEAPLITGSAVHAGIHQYFLSGWRDGEDTGERDIIKATDHALTVLEGMRANAATPEDMTKAIKHTNYCMLQFDEKMVNGGLETIRVAGDQDGNPILEKEFEIPLCEGRFTYVDKIDGMFITSENYYRVGEYKTTTASYARDATLGLGLMGQNLGHMNVTFNLWPDVRVDGIVNFTLVKDRGAKSDLPSIYETPFVIPADVVENYFKNTVETMLERWIDRTYLWRDRIEEGWDPYEAGLTVFPQNGMASEMCKRYRRLCPFAGYCEASGFGSRMLQGFQPRTIAGEPYKEPSEAVSLEGEMF